MSNTQLLANAIDHSMNVIRNGGAESRRVQIFELVQAKHGLFLCDTPTEKSKLGRRLSIALQKLVDAGVLNKKISRRSTIRSLYIIA